MPTPAQSVLIYQGETDLWTFTHEDTFAGHTAAVKVGQRTGGTSLTSIASFACSIAGQVATASILADEDLPVGVYETQLEVTNTGSGVIEIIPGPNIVVKEAIGWVP
jgi:hypothetical protein